MALTESDVIQFGVDCLAKKYNVDRISGETIEKFSERVQAVVAMREYNHLYNTLKLMGWRGNA